MGICRLLFDRYRLAIPRSQALAALRNDRRRSVIVALEGRSGPVAFATLVDLVTARERTSRELDRSVELRPTVYAALYQTHVPQLDRLGVVAHDDDANTVALTDTGRALLGYMRARPAGGSVWAALFLALSVVYAGVVVAAVLEVVTDALWVVAIVAGYATLAVASVLSTVWCNDPLRSCLY